jgi:hypothetical protein
VLGGGRRRGSDLLWDRGFDVGRERRRKRVMNWCRKCEIPIGGFMRTLFHLGFHVVDLAIAAGVAAMVTAALLPKAGYVAILAGTVMGLGLGSFRERTRR